MKILVVEDDEIERMVLYKALSKARADIEMESASTCESAIASLKQQRDFECVFLDYRLPDGSGRELVEKIRHAQIKVPLVVLIAQGDEHYAADLIKAGASDYIPQRKVSSESLARSLHNSVRLYHAEQEAAIANQRLKESEEMYRLVVEGSNDGIWDWDLRTHKVYGNDRLLEMVGLSPQGITINYQLLKKLLHLGDRLKISRAIRAHLKKQVEFEVEFRLRHVSGEYLYCVARGKAQRDGTGKPLRMSGVVRDISERKRTERRAHFLAEATQVLSASLDYQTTLENLAQLAVPRLADWCAIDVVTSEGGYRRIAVTHVDSSKEALVWQLEEAEMIDSAFDSTSSYSQAIHRGKSSACFHVSGENLAELARNEEHLKILKSLNVKSYICVPLKTGERTLGFILFVWSESGRCYTKDDFKLTEDLAHRAALAIENARLYQEAHQASENLRQANAILGQQQHKLRTLQQLTNLLNDRLTDLPDLLRVMARSVCDAIPGAQICFIALFNPQCNRMMLTVTAGIGEDSLSLEDASSSKSLLRQVFLTGQSKLIQNPQQETESAKSLPQTIYAVPIKSVKSGSLGILAIGNWENPKAFSEEGQYLLTAVGEQAAIAIDNARLINTLEEREERLEFQNQILGEQNQELESQRHKIQLQNLQLMEAAKMKSQFLAVMSHELRTPMNAIIGFSQLLLRKKNSDTLSSNQVQMLDKIYNNGKTLLSLINHILDLSKAEAGRLELQLKDFDIVQLVRTTIEELRPLADEKYLSLIFDCNLQHSRVINDSLRLRQIVVNLLSNAIKFTDRGSVKVLVQEIDQEHLEIVVKDSGIGIDAEQKKYIFEEFRQVDQTTTRKYSGTGLGLAITESLVKLMQGEISVESQLGKGSTFRVKLPYRVK